MSRAAQHHGWRDPRATHSAGRRVLRGWTLIELMVGIAVGLLLVSMALTSVLSRVRSDAHLLAEARLGTDLSAAIDTISSDLRRAGAWGHAAAGVDPASSASAATNPYAPIDTASAGAVAYSYTRDAVENDTVDSNERFGWRLHGATLELQLGGGGWQAMTDPAALRIIRFSVTPSIGTVSLADLCPAPCPPAAVDCPPRIAVRTMTIVLEARSALDPDVVRTASTVARVRNDALSGRCPT